MSKKNERQLDQHIGARVRARRMQMGLSQEKLGDALGITFQQVQKMERGTNRIGAGRLLLIARILECGVLFFYAGLPGTNSKAGQDAEPHAEVNSFMTTRHGVALAQAVGKMTDRDTQRALVNLVQQVAAIPAVCADAPARAQ